MELNEHQKRIIDDDPKRCVIGFGTGVGKTAAAIMLSEGSTLVVSSKRAKESRNFDRDSEKLHKLPPRHMSKEEFKKKDPGYYDTLILDEAHFALGVYPETKQKNYKPILKTSQIHECVVEYVRKYNPKRVYLVSATAVEKPVHAWAVRRILGLIEGDEVSNLLLFRSKYYYNIQRDGSLGGGYFIPIKTEKSKKDLSDYISEVAYFGNMDDTTPIVEDVYIKKQIKPNKDSYYHDYTSDYGIRHDYHFDDDLHYVKDSFVYSAKDVIERIKEIAEASNGRYIVFANYRVEVEGIAHVLGVPYVHGGSKEVPQEVPFVCQVSIGEAWERTSAKAAIFTTCTAWRHYEQAKGRIHRYSNKEEQHYYYRLMVKGGASERAWNLIDKKQDLNDLLNGKE